MTRDFFSSNPKYWFTGRKRVRTKHNIPEHCDEQCEQPNNHRPKLLRPERTMQTTGKKHFRNHPVNSSHAKASIQAKIFSWAFYRTHGRQMQYKWVTWSTVTSEARALRKWRWNSIAAKASHVREFFCKTWIWSTEAKKTTNRPKPKLPVKMSSWRTEDQSLHSAPDDGDEDDEIGGPNFANS